MEAHIGYVVVVEIFLIKATKLLTIVKVSISWSSMNDGDVYILDVGEILFVWNGKMSSRTERIKVRVHVQLSLCLCLK